MNAIGIIAEYNPFTNGHLYHINEIKKKYKDHIIILVMSGNFTQRGIPSIIDKFKKTELALKFGIDLVIELPYPFATQSADFFSYGAITILEKLKVEKIVFGSESNNIDDLELIAKTQIKNDELDKLVKIYSKLGSNYPTALSEAIYDLTGKKITTPNDLLGVSYIKTIIENNYKIKYETIKRTNDYHNDIESATMIRKLLSENKSINNLVPEIELNYLNNLHFQNNYFNILKYKIITEEDLSIYQTVDEGIDKLLKKEITNANNIDEYISLIKSKRYTYNKISRMLNHILCNFTKEKAKLFREIKYIRILGLNYKGKKYLNKIKKDLDIPLISKLQREKDEMLEFELETTKIYDIINNNNLLKKECEKIIYLGEQYDKE